MTAITETGKSILETLKTWQSFGDLVLLVEEEPEAYQEMVEKLGAIALQTLIQELAKDGCHLMLPKGKNHLELMSKYNTNSNTNTGYNN